MVKHQKRRLGIALIIIVFFIAWVSSGHFANKSSFLSSKKAEKKGFSVLVKRHKAKVYQRTFRAHGALAPNKIVTLKAEVSGMVTKVLKEDGQRVKKGELLAEIDLQDKLAQLSKEKALLDESKAKLLAVRSLKDKGYAARVNYIAAQAKYKESLARVAVVKRVVNKTKITAPMDGLLSMQWVEVGDYVKVGEKLYELVNNTPLLVKVEVSQYQVKELHLGQEVEVVLITGERLSGQISFISPRANTATRTFTVEITVPNPKSIRSGFSATVVFRTQEGKAHFISPSQLALNKKGEMGVKGIEQGDRVIFYPIVPLNGNRSGVWVLGLPDEVILIEQGQGFVKEGATVKARYE